MMGLSFLYYERKKLFFMVVYFGTVLWLLLREMLFKADCLKLLILPALGKSKA